MKTRGELRMTDMHVQNINRQVGQNIGEILVLFLKINNVYDLKVE